MCIRDSYIIIPAMLIDALVVACPPERLHDMKFAAIQRIRLEFFNPMDANDYLHVQEKGFEVLGFGAVWVLNCSDLTVDVLSAAEKETGGPVFVSPLVPAPVASSPAPTAFHALGCGHGSASPPPVPSVLPLVPAVTECKTFTPPGPASGAWRCVLELPNSFQPGDGLRLVTEGERATKEAAAEQACRLAFTRLLSTEKG